MAVTTKKIVSKKKPKSIDVEPIEIDRVYPLPQFKKMTGFGDTAMRSIRRKAAERNIEIVRYEGGRAFVRGADWNLYLSGKIEMADQSSQAS